MFREGICIIEEKYNTRCLRYAGLMNSFVKNMDSLDQTLQIITKYVCAETSIADLAETDFLVFLDYALHSKKLLEQVKRVESLPKDIFWNYIVHPKAACEELDICRTAFSHLFWEYVKKEAVFWKETDFVFEENYFDWLNKKDIREIANEVNYWCISEAGLNAEDGRMVSAKTVFATAQGNEKEFMVFVVQALRSAGIAARMADLHEETAVEIWMEDKWEEIHVFEPWIDTERYIENSSEMKEVLQKKIAAKKARVQGQQFIKRKNWKNEEREKFFFGDINTMSLRAKLLKHMPEKDQLDMQFDVMESHFRIAFELWDKSDEERFVSYVLNPRIAEEPLSDWRIAVRELFSEDEMKQLRKKPELILNTVVKKFEKIDETELGSEYISPVASIRLGKITEVSGMLLAVAAARSLNVPARYCKESKKGEYWNGTMFTEFQ